MSPPVDRDFFTAQGLEWFEPTLDELVETFQEVRPVGTKHTCARCGLALVPQLLRATIERRRTWTRTGGITGKFGPWEPWAVVSAECPRHQQDAAAAIRSDAAIPF